MRNTISQIESGATTGESTPGGADEPRGVMDSSTTAIGNT